MKIQQLPIGARFEYQGEEYVKTAALFATGPHGQRLIPKYAVLRPLGEAVVRAEPKPDAVLSATRVLGVFDAFYEDCTTLVADDRRDALQAARERFLKALGDR